MITPSKVHDRIQVMDSKLSAGSKNIAVIAIAEELHVTGSDLSIPLETLANLYYIIFADNTGEKIRLTYSGMNTIVPTDTVS